ncbi:toxin [Streptomyces sp. I6]|nr:toxin [Streptomyces sp. I6]
MTDVRYVQIDEILAIARMVTDTERSVRDMGLLVSAIERPRTNVFGAEPYPTLHEKAAALLHSVARDHALIDGNERTAWLAMRVFLRLNGVSASTAPPSASIADPFVEEVARDNTDVPAVAKRPSAWFPVSRRSTSFSGGFRERDPRSVPGVQPGPGPGRRAMARRAHR